jgi:ubiquinol-cytochrome c reductase cytochrome c1 subunit
MKKQILALWLSVGLAGSALASSEGIAWDKFPQEKMTDVASLQNGARLFTNYCLNCHSASYMRYNRLRDIGLSEAQIKDHLMFATDKVGETMKVTIDAKQAKDWFGGQPPDLTVIARSRAEVGKGSGADYLYTLLRSFYRDGAQATGWNNLAFPNIGMPHVLWERQGARDLVITEVKEAKAADGGHGKWEEVRTVHAADGSVEHASKPLADYRGHGSMAYTFNPKDPAQEARYDAEVADLVAFLQWMGEPTQGKRVQVGAWVLLFLGLFTVIAWRLNAAYWKNIK